jgi:uncharacterized protein YjbJ (UPF0337 family)
MKPIHWIIAGVGVGAALTLLLFYQPSSQLETGYDSIEDAANTAWRWGTKKRVGAGADTIVGRVKEGIGRVTGDDDLAGEGIADQAVGAVKDTAGKWGHAIGETLHDLNR